MNTSQINRILKNKNTCFLGTFPADKLPVSEKRPICFIANTDPSTAKGAHWIAIYVNKKNRAEFYDSYGRAPSGIFLDYLRANFDSYRYNPKQVQAIGSSVCGQHCILFLYLRCRGEKMSTITSKFQDDPVVNDAVVCLSINSAYDVNHSLVCLGPELVQYG